MRTQALDFEQPIVELEAKIEELSHSDAATGAGLADNIHQMRGKLAELIETTFSKLTPWQTAQVARHPMRPHTLDYIEHTFTDFDELHGDRAFGDDQSIVGGTARLDGRPVMLIGHEKGRNVASKVARNFGMPRPEGYRKALRLMKMAEKFSLPIITLIDTPGAFPGIDAEERGQSEAIARCIQVMSHLNVPIISTVIGEGGSGGALAIGVCDHLQMLQFSTYSVISPEGCASILWKDAGRAPEAAEAMGLTAQHLKNLNLVDTIVSEPPGGAHRDMAEMGATLRRALVSALERLERLDADVRLQRRIDRLLSIGD
ncbi:MAG: acetyl-CoA carboxylase carboxyltransferase subunit alpha [Gammaproteobacteria bacterium]